MLRCLATRCDTQCWRFISQGGKEPKPEKCAAFAEALVESDVIKVMGACFLELDFEVRKALVAVVRRCVVNDFAGFRTKYLPLHVEDVAALLDHFGNSDAAPLAGSLLREIVGSSPSLHMGVMTAAPAAADYAPLNAGVVSLMTTHVNAASFDVASEALATITALVNSNRAALRELLEAQHEAFFGAFACMLGSKAYVPQLEGLKLLSDLLLDKDNFAVMVRFVASGAHLRCIMTLMRHPQPTVQFEAFHVFKLFVANPEKSDAVRAILVPNAPKLIAFMRVLCNDKDDPEFIKERVLVIQKLEEAAAAAAPATGAAAAAVSGPPAAEEVPADGTAEVAASGVEAPAPAAIATGTG